MKKGNLKIENSPIITIELLNNHKEYFNLSILHQKYLMHHLMLKPE